MKNIIFLFLCLFGRVSLPAQTTLPPEMVFVEGGTFTMGCTEEQEPGCSSDEFPTRLVRLPSFEMGKYEVTQAHWQAVMGSNPSYFTACGNACPVEQVSYYDCITFCNRLSQQQGIDRVYYFDQDLLQPFDLLVGDSNTYVSFYIKSDANGYRLPTESEWEYAARGGSVSFQQMKYSGSDNISEVGWYSGDNSASGTKIVGQKSPNALGLYDMTGHVSEWCTDAYKSFSSNASCIPAPYCCIRGGAWAYAPLSCRISNRNGDFPGNRRSYIGFRVCRNL